MIRLALIIVSVAILVWAVAGGRFYDPDGLVTAAFCAPFSIGISILLVGCSVGTRWFTAAFWLALAICGQAVTLQWIDAGRNVHYQHYRLPAAILHGTDPVFIGIVLFEAGLILLSFKNRFRSALNWLLQNFAPWQLIVIAFTFVFSSAAANRDIRYFFLEIILASLLQALHLGAVILAAAALPQDRLVDLRRQFANWFGIPQAASEPGGLDRFAALAALWTLLVSAGLSVWIYEGHPHVADEAAYVYQARYLASGKLFLTPPAVPEAFKFYLIDSQANRWFSAVPPGWPAVLASGIWLGIPWLINPLLAAFNILLTYVLIREFYCKWTARMTVFLLSLSPWHIFVAMSFMNHTLTLTCALLAALGVARSRRTNHWGWALIAGLAVGFCSLVRPLDALIIAGLLGLWVLGLGGRRLRAGSMVGFGIGCFATGALSLPYNKLIENDAFRSPLMAYTDRFFGPGVNALGFGKNRGLDWGLDPFPGHSPLDAAINAQLNVFSINIEFLGWGTGSLLLLTMFLVSRRLRRDDVLMLAVILAVILFFSLYWFSGGPDFGARYWYLIIIPCAVLTIRGIGLFGEFMIPYFQFAVISLSLISAVNYLPWRALDKYYKYLHMSPGIREIAKANDFRRSLVLIRGHNHPDFASAAVYNPLDWNGDSPLYAWFRNDEMKKQLLQAYPDRPVWIIDGPTITRKHFQIVAGPLSAFSPMNSEPFKQTLAESR